MNKLRIVLALILTALAAQAFAPSNGSAAGDFHLTLLHTSENHGHWDPTVVSNVSQGGIARRATLVKQLRAQIPNLLLLDSGDISQGTLHFVQYKGAEGRDFYNMLGYDAVALGNHEFDLGSTALANNFLNGARFSAVLANVDVSREPALAGKLPASVVKTVGGEKVGLFGLVTDELAVTVHPALLGNVQVKDAVQTARQTVATLEGQGVNKIILLSHRGFQDDLDLASKVEGIDVIVSGHTDTLMGDPDKLHPSLGTPVSPYPAVVQRPGGGRTLVVHAFNWGRIVGRLDLRFDDRGVIQNWAGEPITIGPWLQDNAEVAAKLKDLNGPLDTLRKQVIGRTQVDLAGDRATVRNRESNFGNLIGDAMLWATSTDRTQVALMNGGGIRAGIKTGDVSMGQVLEALPFGNRLVQFDLKGDDLLAAIENGVSRLNPDPGESAGRFLQVAGLRFSADLTLPAGSRVTEVQLKTAAGFTALDRNATYRIVTNDFMQAGGDGFTTLKNGITIRGGDVPLDLAVSDYIKANTPVTAAIEGRINFAGALAPVATAPAAGTMPTLLPAAGGAAMPVGAGLALGLLLLAAGAAMRGKRRT